MAAKDEALRMRPAPCRFIVGTTARQGRRRPEDRTPREAMAEILPLVAAGRIA